MKLEAIFWSSLFLPSSSSASLVIFCCYSQLFLRCCFTFSCRKDNTEHRVTFLGGAGGLLIEPPVVVQLAHLGRGRHRRGLLHRPSSTESIGCWLFVGHCHGCHGHHDDDVTECSSPRSEMLSVSQSVIHSTLQHCKKKTQWHLKKIMCFLNG